MGNKQLNYLVFVLALLLFSQADVQAQCAMCKQAAETSMRSNPHSIARGLNSGILYLMAVPYLLIAFMFRKQIAQLWKKYIRKPAGQEQAD